MFETKILRLTPLTCVDAITQATADGTWEVKGIFTISISVIVILQRRVVSFVPPMVTELYCICDKPLGVIGTDRCQRCAMVIKEKVK